MDKLILKHTKMMFEVGDNRDLGERMQRSCYDDMYKLCEEIDIELNALPEQKRFMVMEILSECFKDYGERYGKKITGTKVTPGNIPATDNPQTINISDFVDESEFNRTGEEMRVLRIKIKRAIVDAKIQSPNGKIKVNLISSKTPIASIINAFAKSVISEWDDIELH